MKANLSVLSGQYAEDYKVRIMFSDNTWRVVDFQPFLFAVENRGDLNKYRNLKEFKKFKIEDDNIVWGKNWDLIFPVEQLHAGKIKIK